MIHLRRKHYPKANSIVLFLGSYGDLNCLLDVMGPVSMILCYRPGAARLRIKMVFSKVIVLDAEVVVIQTPFVAHGI